MILDRASTSYQFSSGGDLTIPRREFQLIENYCGASARREQLVWAFAHYAVQTSTRFTILLPDGQDFSTTPLYHHLASLSCGTDSLQSLCLTVSEGSASGTPLQHALRDIPLRLQISPENFAWNMALGTEADPILAPYQLLDQLLCEEAQKREEGTKHLKNIQDADYRLASKESLEYLLWGFLSLPAKPLARFAAMLPDQVLSQAYGPQWPLSPPGWVQFQKFCLGLACPEDPAVPNAQWNGWGILLALATGYSDLEAIYLAAPTRWRSFLTQLDEELHPKPSITAQLASFQQFQPAINGRFEYFPLTQLRQIPLGKHCNISIYSADGYASGPYSCKRISDRAFQISNPYLGYQISDYQLTGKTAEFALASPQNETLEAASDPPKTSASTLQKKLGLLQQENPIPEEISGYFLHTFCYPLQQKFCELQYAIQKILTDF